MKNKNLHHIKTTGFITPEAYFESFESKLKDKLNKQKALNSIEKAGFGVPKDYFKTIEKTILAKVSESKKPQVVSLFTRRNILYASSIAAAVLLLFNLSLFESKPSFDTLDSETVENYMINENIGSYEIAALLNEDDLLEENFVQYELKEENLETYILNHLDIDDLIIE